MIWFIAVAVNLWALYSCLRAGSNWWIVIAGLLVLMLYPFFLGMYEGYIDDYHQGEEPKE